MLQGYETRLFQSLAVLRFLVFAMGAGLVFLRSPENTVTPVLLPATVVVGLYNLGRVVWRFHPGRHHPVVQGVVAGSDLALSLFLVLITGSLDSPFLVYSLVPILSASLLMSLRIATLLGAASALGVTGAHLTSRLGLTGYPWILDGNYLTFSLLYLGTCFLVAVLPFLANLNWQRRIQRESAALERHRLRREVHDNVAQTLAFLSLKVKRAEERAMTHSGEAITSKDIGDIAQVVEQCYLTVRDYLDGTGEEELEGPLPARLATMAKQWSRETGLPISIQVTREDLELPPRVQYHLLQIAREALANVAKHALASQAWVTLENTPSGIVLRVRDNGRGFPPSQPWGHGLHIMKERAALARASLTVASAPGQGTEVVVLYPADAQKAGP